MKYTVLTDDDRRLMLKKIGVKSIDELFTDLDQNILVDKLEGLPPAVSEIEAEQILDGIGAKNKTYPAPLCGGGCYDHYIPPLVDELSGRGEFYTSYTPYQPEVSQGTLTAIFEFQTYMCRLTGMDVSNASLYDGATALAEAVMMSAKNRKKNKVLVSRSVNPLYRQTLKTYAWASGLEITEIPLAGMVTDSAKAQELCSDAVAAIVIQSPNFFGCIENLEPIAALKTSQNLDLIYTLTEALSLALLKTPAKQGADIVCGEAMSFGNYKGFGGPLLGFMTAKESFMRKMPGRFAGLTVDADGNQAFALTLQAREQHIRREKATSNICSNQGLAALRAAIYLGLMGPKLASLASLNHNTAAYLREQLLKAGFSTPQSTGSSKNTNPAQGENLFFNEFTLHNGTSSFLRAKKGIGIDIGKWYPEFESCTLFCATEKQTIQSIDTFITQLGTGQL